MVTNLQRHSGDLENGSKLVRKALSQRLIWSWILRKRCVWRSTTTALHCNWWYYILLLLLLLSLLLLIFLCCWSLFWWCLIAVAVAVYLLGRFFDVVFVGWWQGRFWVMSLKFCFILWCRTGHYGLRYTLREIHMKLIPGAEKGLLCALPANNDFRNSLL